MTQQQYNEAINLIGHLILTAGATLTELLKQYGVSFKGSPSRSDLIDITIEMLSNHSGFAEDLASLIDIHTIEKADSILTLRRSGFAVPEMEDDFFGGLIKGAIGAIGGLLKKKKKRNRSNNGSNNSSSQADQAKRDLELQIQRMREQQQRREEELRRERERISREREAERRALEEKAKRRTQTMLMVGGGLVVVTLIGVMVFKMRPPAPTI